MWSTIPLGGPVSHISRVASPSVRLSRGRTDQETWKITCFESSDIGDLVLEKYRV